MTITKGLCDICAPKQWKTISTDMLTDSGFPVYGANGIIGYYTEYNHDKPTLLVTCRGATCGTLNICEPYSYVNGNAMALDDLIDEVDIQFLYYYLLHRGFDDVITGSAQPQIVRQSLQKVSVTYPNKERQQVIVDTLKKVSNLITLRKEQLAKLDQLVKSRFIELFGDLKINSKFWCECKIDEACSMIVDCVNKTAPTVEEKTPYKMIRTTNVKRGRINTENVRFVEKETFDKWTRRAVPQMGDIILTREAPMGEVGMVATDESVFLGQRLVLYRVNPNRMNATYLMHLIMSDYFQEQVAYKGKGSTVKHLPVPDCTEFNVLIPNIELQEQFATFVEQIDKSKLTIQQSLDKLELLKKSLMQEYFG